MQCDAWCALRAVVCDGAVCRGLVRGRRGGGGVHDDGAVWSVMVLLCMMVLCVMVVLWMTVLLHVHDGQVVMAGSLHLQGGPHATLSIIGGGKGKTEQHQQHRQWHAPTAAATSPQEK